MEKLYCIEEQKRLSESFLWELQREYFHQKGIDAWGQEVPFFITSNPVITAKYANITLDFMLDWTNNHPESKQHCFYILELGTGSGMFSYYTLKTLTHLINQLQRDDMRFCYVMSDFTNNNVKYWQQHPSLKQFIENGTLDFATYNLEHDKDIKLINAGTVLDKTSIHNPLIVYANYIFDTVSHDSFTIKNNELYESVVTLRTNKNNMKRKRPKISSEIKIQYDERPIDPNHYYEDPFINKILNHYAEELNDTHFLIPTASLRSIKNLSEITQNKMFMITSDKAKSFLSEMKYINRPNLAFHGSFSFTVNYDAIARYFQHLGGDEHRPALREGLKTCIFSLGAPLKTLHQTQRSIQREIDGFMPSEYFAYHQFMKNNKNLLDAHTLSTYLKLSNHDPYVFHHIAPRINEIINDAYTSTKQYIIDMIPVIVDNFYFIPTSHDTYFDVGLFYHTLEKYDKAITFYNLSKKHFGEQFNVYYNLALCHFYLDNRPHSLKLFKRSLDFQSDNNSAREWTAYVENLINSET